MMHSYVELILENSCAFSINACLLCRFINLCVCDSFPFGFENAVWDLIVIVLVRDRCLFSLYLKIS